MSINRRDFLKGGVTAAAAVASFSPLSAVASAIGEKKEKKSRAELNLSFAEGTAPGETLEERLDFMERYGVVGLEPNGRNLAGRINEFQQLLRGRNIKIGSICAGFEGFMLAEEAKTRDLFNKTMRDIIAAAGELGSIGVVMVPLFNHQKPAMAATSKTREYMVEQLAILGEYARGCNTTIILEPLNRREAIYLRQVADAAAICRDTEEAGVKCMGDFWHMTWEETNDYAALMSAGEKYLQHIHVASRGGRKMPGEDGEKDNYLDGFRALKELGYNKYVSFECGSKGDRNVTVPAAVELLRSQWKKA